MRALRSNNVLLENQLQPTPATILISNENGLILDAGADIYLPSGVALDDWGDAFILPGLIDCHTHMGMDGPIGDPVTDRNEPNMLVAPQLRAVDAVDFMNPAFFSAASAGITMVAVLPGPYCVVGGQVGAMKTWSPDLTKYIFRENIGMKCAMGLKPRIAAERANSSPKTKMAVAALLRESIQNAIDASINQRIRMDLGYTGWAPIISGEYPLRVHAYRALEISSAINIADHFGLKLVIEHGAEAIELKEELLKKEIPVVCTNTFFRVPGTIEELASTPELPARLMESGIKVALSTNFPEVAISALIQYAGQCLKYGVTWIQAIHSITKTPAEIMGIYDATGSIKRGKRADFSIWNGDPLSWRTALAAAMINGKYVPNGGSK